MRDYMREYIKDNKIKINEKIKCELCGSEFIKRNKYDHLKTKKHRFVELEKKLEIMKNNKRNMGTSKI